MFLRTESDAELVARTRKGDVEAFNHLVSRWEKRLYNYLLRLLGNRPGYRDDALDLAQEAFLKAYQNIGALAEAEKFPGWLYRIAHNLAFSHIRTQLSRPEPAELAGQAWQGGQDWQEKWSTDWQDSLPSPQGMSSQSGIGREMEIAVTRALDSLSPEQRGAIVLKVYHGFRFEEIAEIISCPLSTVKTRVYSGFTALRAILDTVPAPAKRTARR